MDFGLRPRLCDLPMDEWERCYPNGLGASAYSSPAWQRIMQKLLGKEFEPRALVTETESGQYSLPVFVQYAKYGRVEISTHPERHYVLPIECESADGACIQAIAAAARSPFTRRFRWWMPPWISGELGPASPDPGAEAYLIEITGSAEEYIERTVTKRQQTCIRSNQRRGVEVVERPTENEVEQYFILCNKTHDERGWAGDKYTLDFFIDVASTLGDGGRLVLLRHNQRVVGGGIALFDRHALHYFQGVTERSNGEIKPHVVLYDWFIRTASARGLRYVNLGCVNEGNDSLIRFKQSWGAKPVRAPHVGWDLDRAWLKAQFVQLTGATLERDAPQA